MKMKQIADILQISPADKLKLSALTDRIHNLTANTKEVTTGTCFVAIKGANFDGHTAIKEVFENGAVLAVVDSASTVTLPTEYTDRIIAVHNTHKSLAQLATIFYHNPSADLSMIGVTGTNGKTTVTHLISEIMSDNNQPTGIIGTMYNKIGDTKISTINTTPDANTLNQTLNEMRNQNMTGCAMEVSSIALDQGRTYGVDFNVAVFTNFTEDHLLYHKTMENYFAAKALLFSQLGNGYDVNNIKTAVINTDDSYGNRLIGMTSANIITYGLNESAIVRAKEINISSNGTSFVLSIYGEEYNVNTPLMGMFNVYNTLAAVAACFAMNLAPEQIVNKLSTLHGVEGRFQLVPNDSGITAIVDYAHTPDGLKNVLATINDFAEKRVFCVIGCGGDRDRQKRPLMADVAAQLATNAIFTSDNPRTEDPDAILDDMTNHLPMKSFTRITDRTEAINYALSHALPGDVVLIAGKGHEKYQIIGTTKSYFSDFDVINANFTRKMSLLS